jgi:hypothetical protein
MKEFIYLFRGGKTSDASDAELDAHERAWDDWMDGLEDEGVLIDGLPMKNDVVIVNKEGATVHGFDDTNSVTGYLILEAPDLDAAVDMAQGCPIFDFDGTVEVRALESHLDELHDDADDDGFRDLEP